MSKVALLSDIHFGVNKNSELFLKSCMSFINEQFIPHLKKEKIKDILILGDVFDNRNSINVKISDGVYDLFSNTLKDFNIIILVGNHDIYYKTTIDVHSLKYLKHLPNIRVVDKIEHIDMFGVNTLFCPWIVDYNDESVKDDLLSSTSKILFGHFDIVGFSLNKTRISSEGLTTEVFKNFDYVFSGHYHTPSSKKIGTTEIIYIGNPYHTTRNDIGEHKGFIVFDFETMKYQRIVNKVSLKFVEVEFPNMPDKEDIFGNIVDVKVVMNKKDMVGNIVEKFVDKIEAMKPAEKVNINMTIVDDEKVDNIENVNIASLTDLMVHYVNSDNDIKNKDDVLKIVMSIYEEAK